MDFIESHFVSMGEPDPYGSIVNPLWAAHSVETAWDHATEPNPDITSGEPPTLPDGGAAGRRACSSSASRVAGARACLPSAGGARGVRAFSPSDGGVAGDSVCGDVTRGSPESFGGGGALGEVVAVSH